MSAKKSGGPTTIGTSGSGVSGGGASGSSQRSKKPKVKAFVSRLML